MSKNAIQITNALTRACFPSAKGLFPGQQISFMSDKEPSLESPAASPVGEISHGPSGFDAFLDANQKKLMALAVLLVIGVVAYVIITGLQQNARQAASAEISAASDLPALQAAFEKHKGTPAGAVALDKIAKIQWRDKQQDKAIETLKTIISDYPDHPLIGSVQMTLGNFHRQLEELDQAKSHFEAAVASDSAVSSAALVAIGDLALRVNDAAAAKEAFSEVSTRFGQRHSNFKMISESHEKLAGTVPPTETTVAPKADAPSAGQKIPELAPLPPLEPAPEPQAPTSPETPPSKSIAE